MKEKNHLKIINSQLNNHSSTGHMESHLHLTVLIPGVQSCVPSAFSLCIQNFESYSAL